MKNTQLLILLILGLTSGLITISLTKPSTGIDAIGDIDNMLFGPTLTFGIIYGGFRFLTGPKSLKNYLLIVLLSLVSYLFGGIPYVLLSSVDNPIIALFGVVAGGFTGAAVLGFLNQRVYETRSHFLLSGAVGAIAAIIALVLYFYTPYFGKGMFYEKMWPPFYIMWHTGVMVVLGMQPRKGSSA